MAQVNKLATDPMDQDEINGLRKAVVNTLDTEIEQRALEIARAYKAASDRATNDGKATCKISLGYRITISRDKHGRPKVATDFSFGGIKTQSKSEFVVDGKDMIDLMQGE